jgi:hypothetical protein
LFGFTYAAAWLFVCYCVIRMYVGAVIMSAPLTVGSSPCLCSCVVYSSVYVDLTDLTPLRWLITNVNSVLVLRNVVVGSIADVSEVYIASIFMGETCRLLSFCVQKLTNLHISLYIDKKNLLTYKFPHRNWRQIVLPKHQQLR